MSHRLQTNIGQIEYEMTVFGISQLCSIMQCLLPNAKVRRTTESYQFSNLDISSSIVWVCMPDFFMSIDA